MPEAVDYFAVLGLPRSIEIDLADLEDNYLRLCAAVHPDSHNNAGSAFLEASEEKASLINQAYQFLKDDLSRAEHILGLCGGLDSASHRAMAPEILEQQLEWREFLEESPELDTIGLEKHLARAKKDWRELWAIIKSIFPTDSDLAALPAKANLNEIPAPWLKTAREHLNHGRFFKGLIRELTERIHKNMII